MRLFLQKSLAGLMLIGAAGAWAQSGAMPSKADAADAAFEESIRDFGYVSGAAYQCLPEGKRISHEKEVIGAFDGLVRLFGSDRAFYYAAAFGAGSIERIDKSKCGDFLGKYQSATKSTKKDR